MALCLLTSGEPDLQPSCRVAVPQERATPELRCQPRAQEGELFTVVTGFADAIGDLCHDKKRLCDPNSGITTRAFSCQLMARPRPDHKAIAPNRSEKDPRTVLPAPPTERYLAVGTLQPSDESSHFKGVVRVTVLVWAKPGGFGKPTSGVPGLHVRPTAP
jgi:hypothetical protein